MKYITIILGLVLLMGCTNPNSPSKARRTPSEVMYGKTTDNSESVRDLVYTEHFNYMNHSYILFVFAHGTRDHSVVHDPDCVYCQMNKPIEEIYEESN